MRIYICDDEPQILRQIGKLVRDFMPEGLGFSGHPVWLGIILSLLQGEY